MMQTSVCVCVWQSVPMQGLTAFTNLCCRFAINFIESKSNNIALHINPRIKDKVVVRNTRIGDIWGKEERELIFNPFGPGLFFDVRALYIKSTRFNIYQRTWILKHFVFQMLVTCDNDKFKVSVDGEHLFDYHHKLKPVNVIDTLEIVGDVELSYISFWDLMLVTLTISCLVLVTWIRK